MRTLALILVLILGGTAVQAAGTRPLARAIEPVLRPVMRPAPEASTIPRMSTMSVPVLGQGIAVPLISPARVEHPLLPFVPTVLRRWDGWAARAERGQLRAVRPAARQGVLISSLAVDRALRPTNRPAGITLAALAQADERRRGSVCGDPGLQGATIGRVAGPGACGIEGAVEVRSVAGIALSSPARIDCRTAEAFLRWVEAAARPQFANVGGGLAQIDLMGTYSCRTRNNRIGARLSEHSFGHAIDIGGFRMRDGTRVTVLRDWNTGYGNRLRALHRAACGTFGTVLGPNANTAHRDHFHFDTARYRSGSYCR